MTAGVAGATALEWLSSLPNGRASRMHIVCDFDGDGLAAGALLVRSLRHDGYRDVSAECRRKGESAWGPEIADRLQDRAASHGIDALIVADLGSRDGVLLRNETGDPVPLLLIDHHCPTGQPQGSTLISSYGDGSAGGDGKDIATAGLMSWWAAHAVAGDSADAWLWLAAISILSDMGETAPFSELAMAKSHFGITSLRKATSLLNALRRSSAGRADVALALLVDASGPKDVIDGTRPETAELQRAKSEVDEELAIARKQPPRFNTTLRSELGADLVAIRMHSACQVHPLVAQQWRGRFAKYVVFGVNTGYRPGWVHFSARAPAGVNLLEFLARHRPPEADDAYGMGHDQASGGALPVHVWNRWIQEMGFGEEMRVSEE